MSSGCLVAGLVGASAAQSTCSAAVLIVVSRLGSSLHRIVSLPRALTVATPSVPISTWSSKPANPPVLETVSGRPAATGVDWVTLGVPVGVLLGAGEGGALPVPSPDSSPHPVRTSPATAATTAYLLRFLTHHGYPQ
jgi:hypothetical protein